MAPGRLTVMLLWLGAATASQRRKNKKKADAAAAGRPPSMTLDARPLKYKDDALGLYAKTWAAAHTNRTPSSRGARNLISTQASTTSAT